MSEKVNAEIRWMDNREYPYYCGDKATDGTICAKPGKWFDCRHVLCEDHQADALCPYCYAYENSISFLERDLVELEQKTIERCAEIAHRATPRAGTEQQIAFGFYAACETIEEKILEQRISYE